LLGLSLLFDVGLVHSLDPPPLRRAFRADAFRRQKPFFRPSPNVSFQACTTPIIIFLFEITDGYTPTTSSQKQSQYASRHALARHRNSVESQASTSKNIPVRIKTTGCILCQLLDGALALVPRRTQEQCRCRGDESNNPRSKATCRALQRQLRN